jgi:hypothetical protein
MGKKIKIRIRFLDEHPGSYFRELWVEDNYSVMRIRIRDPESFSLGIRDPGWKNSDTGYRINIQNPQHCYFAIQNTGFIQMRAIKYQYVRIGTLEAF